MVGTGRADLDELGCRLRRDELERLRRLVDAQQLRALRRGGAADRGQQLHERRVPCRLVERDARRAAEAPGSMRAVVDERDGLVDGLDRRVVGLLRGVAPHHEPVLAQHDEAQAGRVAHDLADLLREREARADVRDPGGRVAEALPHELLAVGRAGQDVDAVGMRVVDVRRRHEGVQQRLDRGSRHGGIELAAHEVGDHLLVAHGVARDQRQHLLQAERREALRPHRGEVAARALDPHDRALGARVVDGRALGRGVAAAEVRDRAIGAQQVGGVHEGIQRIARSRAVGGPEVGSGCDELGRSAHRAPRIASAAERSAAMRSVRPDERRAATGSAAAPSACRALAQSGRTSVL